MRSAYKYNDIYINLGELGEHELDITAARIGQPHEPVRMVIMRALVYVRFDNCPLQLLDVTTKIRGDLEWIERVTNSYLRAQEALESEPA